MKTGKNEIDQIIQKILRQLMSPEGAEKRVISMEDWEWPQGVALFAMYQYYCLTNKTEILEYLKNWYDRKISRGLPRVNINTTCPMLTLTYLYQEMGEKKYLPYLEYWCREVMEKSPRTREGGLQHVTSDYLFDGQLWDDTLYMAVLFLARMGVIGNDKHLLEESVRQFLIHIKYLTDKSTGLFYHGWNFNSCNNFAGALWGRGNAWYTAGLVDYLSMFSVEEGVKSFLCSTLERQVEALAAIQDESGLWHTILNEPWTYLETSASSGFAYGILKAVRMGLLSEKYEETGIRAVYGVLDHIDSNGIVQDVSSGTPVFSTIEEYNQVVIEPMPYGQSMAMLMLAEALYHKSFY